MYTVQYTLYKVHCIVITAHYTQSVYTAARWDCYVLNLLGEEMEKHGFKTLQSYVMSATVMYCAVLQCTVLCWKVLFCTLL